MNIQDISFVEETKDLTLNGAGANSGVNVSAYGSQAYAEAFANGYGISSGAKTGTKTRAISKKQYEAGSASAFGASYGVSLVNGRPQLSTSYTFGTDSSVLY